MHHRRMCRQTPEARQRIETIYSIMDFPDSIPHFDNLIVADDGALWVKRYSTLAPRRWYVFNVDGRWLGSIELPERFTPSGVADDLVYGVDRDADDVELVQVFRVQRSG
jgi:hypothetical protein